MKEEEKQIKYEEYGYADENVVMGDLDYPLYKQIGELAQFAINFGSQVGFEEKESLAETFGPENTAKRFFTPQATVGFAVIERLNAMHVEKVKAGVAKHYTELQQEVGAPETDNPLKVV